MVRLLKKISSAEIYMKIKEKFYPKFDSNPTYSPRLLLAKAMTRFDICEAKKKPSQIRAEIKKYKKFWKCYPYDYFLCDLYREDNPLTTEELINFIPSFFWYYLYLPHHTSYKYSMITDNKLITEQIFHSLNIAQPKTLCRIIKGNLYSHKMQRWSFEQVRYEITKNCYEKIFVKPALGGGSKGIYVFHKNKSGDYFSRNNNILNEQFLSSIGKMNDYIVQPGILQSQQISKIYPESVNTCRIITENINGVSRAVCAVLRIGRGQNEVDNASAGGIFLKIDIKNGIIGQQAMSYDNEKFRRHPDTHFIFENFKILHWDNILKFSTDCANKLPFFTHLGWDIALTSDGPTAIEVNLGPGIEILQISHGGLRKEFGIEKPDFYWKNLGRRNEHFT